MRRLCFLILCIAGVVSCVSDPAWIIPYEVISDMSFGVDYTPRNIQIINRGDGTPRFAIGSGYADWISVAETEGNVDGAEKDIELNIRKENLEEGENRGILSLKIYDVPIMKYDISVSAFGKAEIKLSSERLSFGTSASSMNLVLSSEYGQRTLNLTTSDDWLGLSEKSLLFDNDRKEITVSVECDRKNLSPGMYEGEVLISSLGGTYSGTVAVNIVVPLQDEKTVSVDDYVFKSSSSPYRSGTDKVVVPVSIMNASKYYRGFNVTGVEAIGSDGNSYSSQFAYGSVLLQSNQAIEKDFTFSGIPSDVNGFSELKIITDLSEDIVFNNLKF